MDPLDLLDDITDNKPVTGLAGRRKNRSTINDNENTFKTVLNKSFQNDSKQQSTIEETTTTKENKVLDKFDKPQQEKSIPPKYEKINNIGNNSTNANLNTESIINSSSRNNQGKVTTSPINSSIQAPVNFEFSTRRRGRGKEAVNTVTSSENNFRSTIAASNNDTNKENKFNSINSNSNKKEEEDVENVYIPSISKTVNQNSF